jgi:type VI secretion system protein VasD
MRPTPRSPRFPSAASVALLALGVAGCSLFGGEKAPAPLRLRVSAAARLNPDDRGESLPTAVRVYQLKDPTRARSVELGPLLRDPKEALGEAFLTFDEVFVDPGARSERTVAIDKAARAVAIVAVFRRPAGESWREVIELPSSGRSVQLEYVLDEYRMSRRP